MKSQVTNTTLLRKALFRARRIGISVATVYAGVCIFLALFQSCLIYRPSGPYVVTPADVGLRYEEVTLLTDDGVRLGAWYVPHARAKGTVLFCHGNAGNISHRVAAIKGLHDFALNVLIFDYRGFGRSEGRPSEAGIYRDAETAWRFLVERRGEPPQRIVVFGRSLGGAVAIELASHHHPAALVVHSTFTRLADVAARLYWFLPVRWILRPEYASIDKIARVACPKLFVHGADDELIPIELGRRLFAAAGEPREFIEIPSGHNTSGFTAAAKYTEKLRAFLFDALSDPTP